jgi:cell division transport system ATP-binding protein
MIRFEQVYKQYQVGLTALDNISVEIEDGEFVFVIGPSGAGKTTMLRLLIHDLEPSKGKIFFNKQEIVSMSRNKIHLLRRNFGMVFQDFKLLEDRTVFENVAISLEIRGKSQSSIMKEVKDVLGLVSLSEKANLFPIQLSAGELQRAGIARAIVSGPKVLLADEPTGNLDPATSWEILEILEEINKLGTTIIMATHNSLIVNELNKRTLVMEKGKIIADEKKGRYPKVIRKVKK